MVCKIPAPKSEREKINEHAMDLIPLIAQNMKSRSFDQYWECQTATQYFAEKSSSPFGSQYCEVSTSSLLIGEISYLGREFLSL
jgi:hypothetical protein